MNAGSRTTARWNGSAVGHALDDHLVERAAGALQRLLAGRAGDDQLGQQRVEVAADDAAGLDAGVDAHARARREPNAVTVPGAGRKPRPGSSPLMRNSMRVPARRRVLGDVELLALGDAELLADQVDAGGLLGHRVLDLQAGVDLEEGDGAVLADEVLDGAGAVVAGLLADGLGRRVDAGRAARR